MPFLFAQGEECADQNGRPDAVQDHDQREQVVADARRDLALPYVSGTEGMTGAGADSDEDEQPDQAECDEHHRKRAARLAHKFRRRRTIPRGTKATQRIQGASGVRPGSDESRRVGPEPRSARARLMIAPSSCSENTSPRVASASAARSALPAGSGR